MQITFLGTGTSQGVPMIACDCEVCSSPFEKDKRLRSSIMVNIEGRNFVIDTGPDFRSQMLREKVKEVHAVLLTHEHKDHTACLDDVRAFNYFMKEPMRVYSSVHCLKAIRKDFDYVFSGNKYPGIPEINLHEISKDQSFMIDNILITPIEVLHLHLPVLGYRIDDFTYITDANFISPTEFEKIKGSKVLVLNALRHAQHVSHFTLNEAIHLAQKVGAERTYFTHISHQMGTHDEVQPTLPGGIFLAYDGLKIEC